MTFQWSCFLIACFPLFASAQPGKADIKKFSTIDKHKIHYQLAGTGTTTVVFESGHGDDLNSWDNVFPEVAKFARVVRYDREGYGLSDTNTQHTSLTQIAERLHKLLQHEGIHPPYVLAGHSFGGALIRAYAFLYPTEVAGLVFVDPFNEYNGNEIGREQIEEGAKELDSITQNSMTAFATEWRIIKSELLNGSPEINSFGALPDIPVVLLTAGKDRPPGWDKSLASLFQNKIKNLSESRLIELPQSPHHIQYHEPSVVIENIRRVVFPDAGNILHKTLTTKGVDSCIAQYKKIRSTYPKEYMLERFLNTLGYSELRDGRIQEAIKLFRLNVEMYPQSGNVYDSLGEAYAAAGNKKEAITNYEQSLAKDPANTNAEKMLKKLKSN